MTENALLLAPHPAVLARRVGGLSVLERHLWTLRRAGIARVWVGAPSPAEAASQKPRLPPGLEIRWSNSQSAAELECAAPYLALTSDHFIRVETLAYIARQSYGAPVALHDSQDSVVVRVVNDSRDRVTIHRQPLPPGSTCRLDGREVQSALPWLLALGVKAQDGFMARNFDRHVSLAMSRLLLDTRVTPNMMTIMSSLIGLGGAAFFLIPTYSSRLAGALLIWLHSVLDGCDGELARIRFQESPLGADIDFWGDNIVHVALFACLSYGFFRVDQSAVPLILGLAAAAGTVGSAALAYRQRLAQRRGQPAVAQLPRLAHIAEILAARDFIYLLILLAYLDRLYEFLWAGAVGSLLFFLMMLYPGRKHHEQADEPHPPDQGKAGSPAAGHGSGHQHLYRGS